MIGKTELFGNSYDQSDAIYSVLAGSSDVNMT